MYIQVARDFIFWLKMRFSKSSGWCHIIRRVAAGGIAIKREEPRIFLGTTRTRKLYCCKIGEWRKNPCGQNWSVYSVKCLYSSWTKCIVASIRREGLISGAASWQHPLSWLASSSSLSVSSLASPSSLLSLSSLKCSFSLSWQSWTSWLISWRHLPPIGEPLLVRRRFNTSWQHLLTSPLIH